MKRSIFSLLFHYPKLLLLIIIISGGVYYYEYTIARPLMVYKGIPKVEKTTLNNFTRIFRNKGFMVGYSDWRGNPLWVSYRLKALPKNAPRFKRPDGFHVDWRNLSFVSQQDYTRSGYDRGHMAPNYAISRLYGKSAQEETFLMTNITPQRANLNQKVWQRLEQLELDRFAPRYEELWVYTGPVFDQNKERLKSSFKVEIPDAFYKVYAGVMDTGFVEMAAFIIPQSVRGYEKLERFSVSVDDVEAKTGFDFFHELDPAYEVTLEEQENGREWVK